MNFLVKSLASIVAYQQINRVLGDRINDQLSQLSEFTAESLSTIPLSTRKRQTILNVMVYTQTHAYDRSWPSAQCIEYLTSISGIGSWTAKIHLIFTEGRTDVFLYEDLEVRRGYALVNHTQLLSVTQMSQLPPWDTSSSLKYLAIGRTTPFLSQKQLAEKYGSGYLLDQEGYVVIGFI